jgi:hypothetical protein
MKITAGNISIELEPQLVNQENVTMAIQAAQNLVALQTERLAVNLGSDIKAAEAAEKLKAAGA